jgi:hypothetical protein
LYLTLRSHISLGEVARHFTPDQLSRLRDEYRLTEFWVDVHSVLDCCADEERRESGISGLTTDEVCRVNAFQFGAYRQTQQVAAVAFEQGFEGLLVPSCTRFSGGNLVLFPTNLQPGSRVQVVRAEDPVLYVERPGV